MMTDHTVPTWRQRFARAGVIGLLINAPVCWLAWLAVLKVSPSPIVSQITIVPLVIVIAMIPMAMFGTFGLKGVRPTVTPIPMARPRFRGWATVWIALVVVSLVLGAIVFSRVSPPSEAGLVGSATRMHDGRYALVSVGESKFHPRCLGCYRLGQHVMVVSRLMWKSVKRVFRLVARAAPALMRPT